MQLTKPEIWQDNAANALDYALHFTNEGRLSDALVWADTVVRILLAEKTRLKTERET